MAAAILGGGYGAAQVAITGADWLPGGWKGAEFLLLLCGAKLLATSLTVGTGGSAGDFGPSLVLGGLFGGAFGRAAAILLHDPSIDPGAFALVGMGTFYGGLAHVPVSSLIMVSELAGSYDLLVPLMLAEGIAFVALRKRFLYDAQVPTFSDSPVHRPSNSLEVIGKLRVAEVLPQRAPVRTFRLVTGMSEMHSALTEATWQVTFPVVDSNEHLLGVVSAASIGLMAPRDGVEAPVVASDLLQPAEVLHLEDDLRKAGELLLGSGLHQLPVLTAEGKIAGFIDESHVTRAYLTSTDEPGRPPD